MQKVFMFSKYIKHGDKLKKNKSIVRDIYSFKTYSYIFNCECKMVDFALAALSALFLFLAARAIAINVHSIQVWINVT